MAYIDDILAKIKPVYGIKKFYRLRYRFDYSNRPTKIGYWDMPDPQEQGVWTFKKDGLVRVAIEGERVMEGITKTLLEVDGHEYASMRWVNLVSLGGGGFKTVKYSMRGYIAGLTILTNRLAATVFIDGKGDVRDLNEYEKKFKLREYKY